MFQYDRDGSGTIDAQELATMLREDAEVSDKIVRKLILYSDRNNDSKINVDEFTDMVLDKKLTDLFGKYITRSVTYWTFSSPLKPVLQLRGLCGAQEQTSQIQADWSKRHSHYLRWSHRTRRRIRIRIVAAAALHGADVDLRNYLLYPQQSYQK